MKKRLPRKMPRKCECGGRLVYTWAFGQWWNYCNRCTPMLPVKETKHYQARRDQ